MVLSRFRWMLVGIALLGAVAGLIAMAVVSYVMPKQFESEAVIEVSPLEGEEDFLGSAEGQETPAFLEVAIRDIKSRGVIGRVVENLKLNHKWSVDREASIQTVESAVNPRNIRASSLISIRVRHTNKIEARDIAVEVAKVYKAKRDGIQRLGLDQRLKELIQAINDQEEKVAERRKALSEIEIVRKKNITVDGTETLLHLPDSQEYIDAKRDFESDQTLLQRMEFKQVSAMIARRMPDESVVVHDEPQFPQVPVPPYVTFNLILGAVGGFLLCPLLSLPLILLLNRLNSATESGMSADQI